MPKVRYLEGKFTTVTYELLKACEADELALYCFIKLHAVGKHKAWPSYNSIQACLGWGRSRISGVLKLMEQSRRLRIERVGGRVNVYDITAYDRLGISFMTSPETGLGVVPKRDWYQSRNGTRTNTKKRIQINNKGGVTHSPVDNPHKPHSRKLSKEESDRLRDGIYPLLRAP